MLVSARMTGLRFFLALLIFCCCNLLWAASPDLSLESEGVKLKVELVAEGFTVPWAMVFLSPQSMLITERQGFVYRLNLQTGAKLRLKNLPRVFTAGQAGLLDLALSPDYSHTGWIYFTYVKAVSSQVVTVLARARLSADRFSQWQDLLVTDSHNDSSRHFGSRIAFDNKGHVFFGIGDRGHRPNAQDLSNHAGAILRLNLDGSVPADNPFVKHNTAKPEIWSYGHRNPQGLVYDVQNNRLWSNEHGPRGGDELNLITKAQNYGWPVISYGQEYWGPLAVGEATHRAGMQQPVKEYTPSIAPGSLLLYNSNAVEQWRGNLFAGALKLRHINRIVLNSAAQVVKEERLLEALNERIRALAQSPQGWLYFSTDSGKLYRIKPYQ